ncbi:MAG: alpha/beta hydrolase [Gammaproteobacteria bacterium]
MNLVKTKIILIGMLATFSLFASITPAVAYSMSQQYDMDIFDTLQKNAWYLPTADGQARLYVTSFGHGPTVIVLHGGPGNDFHYLMDALRPLANQYRFELFDQRGSLLSPVPCDEVSKLTMQDLVNDIETLRQSLGQEKIILLGHSFGTLLAEFYFKAYPQRVAGMVLAGAVPPRTPVGGFGHFIRDVHHRQDELQKRPEVSRVERAAGLPAGNGDKLTHQEAMHKFKIEAASIDLYHVDRWRELQGGGVYYNQKVDDAIGDSLPNSYDISPALRIHAVPISIIQGDHDYIDPSASLWIEDMHGMGNVRVYVLKDAGHYS